MQIHSKCLGEEGKKEKRENETGRERPREKVCACGGESVREGISRYYYHYYHYYIILIILIILIIIIIIIIINIIIIIIHIVIHTLFCTSPCVWCLCV